MARVVWVTGDKGGVGKSFYTRLLVGWYRENNREVGVFDTDKANPTLNRFYGQIHGVNLLDVEDPAAMDTFLEHVANGPKEAVYVVDCAARTFDTISNWMKDVDFDSVKSDLGIMMTVPFLLGPDKDSLKILKHLSEALVGKADLVVVQNSGRGSSFKLYEESQTRKRLQAEGVKEQVLPPLLEKSNLELDRNNLPFREARESSILQIADRARVKRYVSEAFRDFDQSHGIWT